MRDISAGTLLQPKMKKKRSVTRLTAKDTQKSSKYVLTHQEVDSDGAVTTSLVKVRSQEVMQSNDLELTVLWIPQISPEYLVAIACSNNIATR